MEDIKDDSKSIKEDTKPINSIPIEKLSIQVKSEITDILSDHVLNIEKSFNKDDINELFMSKWITFKNKFFVLQMNYKDALSIKWDEITVDKFSDYLFEVDLDDIKSNDIKSIDQKDNIRTMMSMLNRFDFFFVEIVIYDNKKRVIFTSTIKAYKANRKYHDVKHINPINELKNKTDRKKYIKYIRERLLKDYKINGKLPETLDIALKRYLVKNVEYKNKYLFPVNETVTEIVYINLPKTLNQ